MNDVFYTQSFSLFFDAVLVFLLWSFSILCAHRFVDWYRNNFLCVERCVYWWTKQGSNADVSEWKMTSIGGRQIKSKEKEQQHLHTHTHTRVHRPDEYDVSRLSLFRLWILWKFRLKFKQTDLLRKRKWMERINFDKMISIYIWCMWANEWGSKSDYGKTFGSMHTHISTAKLFLIDLLSVSGNQSTFYMPMFITFIA